MRWWLFPWIKGKILIFLKWNFSLI